MLNDHYKYESSFPTASSVIDDFCKLSILSDLAPNQSRNKKFIFGEYLNILEKGTEQNS